MSEQIMADVMLGRTSQEVGICRISCNAVASQAMFCPKCGNVLDQKTTIVITVKTPKRRVVVARCTKCWKGESETVIIAAKETQTPCLIEGWNGVIFSQGNVENS